MAKIQSRKYNGRTDTIQRDRHLPYRFRSLSAKKKFEYNTEHSEVNFSAVKGMMFGAWIDANARTTGYNEGDLIQNPAYVIESILRDWVFRENDLQINTVTDSSNFILDGLKSTTDDYYNNAYIFNVTTNEYDQIDAYAGTTKTVTTFNPHVGWSANDNLFITNIQGSARIDSASFDAIGNTTNGLRDDWFFDFALSEKISAVDLLRNLAFESHCALIESAGRFRLVALDTTTVTATWTNPLKLNGLEYFSSGFTPVQSLYTDYSLTYGYDVAQKRNNKSLFCNKSGQSSVITPGYSTLCLNTETNFRYSQKFNYDCQFIQDENTAEVLFKSLITHFTKQRHIVTWGADPKNCIQYELGDVIKINYASLMPDSLNNSARYMIIDKTIRPEQNGNPYIVFTLMQMD